MPGISGAGVQVYQIADEDLGTVLRRLAVHRKAL